MSSFFVIHFKIIGLMFEMIICGLFICSIDFQVFFKQKYNLNPKLMQTILDFRNNKLIK